MRPCWRRVGPLGLLLGTIALAACGAEAGPESAQPQGFVASEEEPVTAQLIAEHASIQPGGRTRIGVLFELEEGWHIYAEDPGDAGLPTTVTWTTPAGASTGPLHYPVPHEFMDPGDILTFGYDGMVVLSSTLQSHAAHEADDVIPIQAQVKWLACNEICIPGSAELTLSLPVSTERPVVSTHAHLFEHTS